MKAPEIPTTEQQRLAVLYRYQILDTQAEQEFNDIVALAAHICQTPISAISLVDKSRQWFKGIVGFDAKETSREVSFCGHTILGQDIFVVEDTHQDQRFFDNPLVTSAPHIRFYAGVPLITEDGHALGSICVIDHQVRYLTDAQMMALKSLSHQVIKLLEARLFKFQLADANHELFSINAQLKTAFEVMPNLICINDIYGNNISCNASFARLVGESCASLIGKTTMDLLAKDVAKPLLALEKKAIKSKKLVTSEVWLTFPDGYRGLFETSHSLIFDENAMVKGVLLMAQDVTHQYQLQNKVTHQHAIFTALNDIASQSIHVHLNTRLLDMLNVGMRYLGYHIALVGKLENDHFQILVGNSKQLQFQEGYTHTQAFTLHRLLLDMQDSEVLQINQISKYEPSVSNCYEVTLGVQSYLGMLVKETTNVHYVIALMSMSEHQQQLTDEDISFIHLLGRWITNIIARDRMADCLLQSNQRMELAIEGANLGLWDWHVPSGEVVLNIRWYEMLGYQKTEIEPTMAAFENLIHMDDKAHFFNMLERHFKAETTVMHVEFRMRHQKGHWVWIEHYGRAVEHDKRGVPTRLLGTHMDITKRKKDEDEIRHLAFYDALTALPNRRLLMDRLARALATSARSECHGALFFIDIDHFKTLNDTLGHDKGDILLKQVAERLTQSVRDVDTVARLGGDEFVVMLENLDVDDEQARAQVELVGKKLLNALYQPYLVDDGDYHSTSSVGVTIFHGHQDTLEELLKRADMAMYQAKDDGRNCMRFFDPDMQTMVKERVKLADDMRNGIKHNEFSLFYQPQIDIEGQLTGAEALLRWKHPRRGMVPPNEFIPLAEETGIILRLGRLVLEMGCNQLVAWSKLPHTAHIVLSINVSARQFHQADFVCEVLEILKKTGANPKLLKLELTESMLVQDVEDIIEKMEVLRKAGVRFSLDDFGTGFSSLSYLKRLPLTQLKIDQSFVRDVLTDPNDAVIACTIVTLARSLGLGVIAEGVETEAQRDFLAENGCHDFQGYYFSRPLAIDQFNEYSFGLNFSHYSLRNEGDGRTLPRLSIS